MEFRAFATKLIAPACLIRHLTLAIVIVPALLSGPALAVDINQHGLTGSWYNPALIMILPPGAFILIGYMIGAIRLYDQKKVDYNKGVVHNERVSDTIRERSNC
jgi:hypothetical protein